MPTLFDENVGRVTERGWIVDRDASRRSYGTDHIDAYDSDYKDYGVGVGIDSQSGKVKDVKIIKDPLGEERCAKPWKEQSIPTPEEAAASFELPERQSLEMMIIDLEACAAKLDHYMKQISLQHQALIGRIQALRSQILGRNER